MNVRAEIVLPSLGKKIVCNVATAEVSPETLDIVLSFELPPALSLMLSLDALVTMCDTDGVGIWHAASPGFFGVRAIRVLGQIEPDGMERCEANLTRMTNEQLWARPVLHGGKPRTQTQPGEKQESKPPSS